MLQGKLLRLKIVCIILFCISFVMVALIILALLKLYFSKEYDSILDPIPLIVMGGFLLIGIFQLKCFNLVVNKYPDKVLTNTNDSAFNLFFIFSTIVFLAIFFCFVAIVFTLLNESTTENNSIIFYVLIVIFSIFIPCHVYCMRQSYALRKTIKINYYKSQNNMIDTIGQDKNISEGVKF